MMIVDERIVTFINSMETENSEILEVIEREALDSYVPIIRKEMQSFLKLLLSIQKPMGQPSQRLKIMTNEFQLHAKILNVQGRSI